MKNTFISDTERKRTRNKVMRQIKLTQNSADFVTVTVTVKGIYLK